jgi:hypothetical protein
MQKHAYTYVDKTYVDIHTDLRRHTCRYIHTYMHISLIIFVSYIFTRMHFYTNAYIYLYVTIRLWIYTSSMFIERHAYTPAYKCAYRNYLHTCTFVDIFPGMTPLTYIKWQINTFIYTYVYHIYVFFFNIYI